MSRTPRPPVGAGSPNGARISVRRAALSCLALTTLAVTAVAGPAQAVRPDAELKAARGQAVQGEYIVVLKEGTDGSAVARRNGVSPHHVYSAALEGFAGRLSKGQLAKVRQDPAVAYVEPNTVATINAKPSPPADPALGSTGPSQLTPTPQTGDVSSNTVQNGATWGIDRIDQATGLSGTYVYTDTGAGTTAYVLDTGILTAHTQFGGRASVGFDAIGDGRNGQDCHGHGTHVAGTIGGSTYGVAKGVRLVAVRVLDCAGNGSFAGIIAGIDWVTYNRSGPSVANMSLGGGFSQATNDAVARSTARGVTHVVAAGNSSANACNFSPASAPSAITVAATTRSGTTDTRDTTYSNFGPCVDVFAPGTGITSAWNSSTTAILTISGTSMASPHVAGLASLYLQSNAYAAPATVTEVLKSMAVVGIVANAGTGTPNLFARKWVGTLSGTGANSYQPDGTYWFQANAGYVQGWLAGTGGTDPDLYLERWNGSAWVQVTGSASTTARERVVANVPGNSYYRLRIRAFNGGGSYDVWTNHPA